MLRIGMFLGERYEILEKIGSGGMSDVYKAKCHKLNRYVAVKVLKDEYSSDKTFVSKFKVEAQSAAGLSHPNIVSIYDVGNEGQLHYIVMELVEGVTLKDYIQRKGQLEIREAVSIAIQVAQGIEAAHEQHIVHRDIKPQNVIISKDGKVKVMDFGIAKAASTETINSNAIGSVHYISPEQARGVYCDERSDIYSLGITMYEMLTGRVPYEGDSSVAVAVLHLTGEIVPPSEYIPDIPDSLEQIILKCTEKKTERRYSSANELIADLKKFLVSPYEDFVKRTPVSDSSPTVMFNKNDVEQQMSLAVSNEKDKKMIAKKKRLDEEDEEDDTNPKIERILNIVGIGVAILIVALVIFLIARFTNVFKAKPSNPTSQSSENELAADEVYMPNLLGSTADDAEKILMENSLGRSKYIYANSNTVEKGLVMAQSVESGTIIKKHSQVEITISEGPETVDINGLNITGLTVEEAKSALTEKKLLVTVQEEYSDTVEKDKVIRYEPKAGLVVGDTVTLYVSLGVEIVYVTVPNLVGLTKPEAQTALEQEKLKSGAVSTEYSSTVAEGLVIRQGTSANSEVLSGTTIDFVISNGPTPVVYKYYATINVTFDCSSYFGPGGGSELQIKIMLKQNVNGEDKYSTLIPTATVGADSKITIQENKILGADGVDTGEVLVVNAEDNTILKSYPVVFTKTEVAP